MMRMLYVAILILAALSLTSCGYVVRESGFLYTDFDPHFETHSSSTPGRVQLWYDPCIYLESSCDGTDYTVTFGPYFALPLFIIPNPLLPFTYPYHTFKSATITLAVDVPAPVADWDAVSPKLSLNGVALEVDHITDAKASWGIKRSYVYHSHIRCGRLDDSKIIVELAIPRQAPLTRTLYYRHRWRVVFEGM